MENEIFDEARKCSHCGIVTYCDNCPSCGRNLPRTNKSYWKLRHGKDVAGEEENVSQTMDHGGFQERADIREASRKQHGDNLFKQGHAEPKVSFERNPYERKVEKVTNIENSEINYAKFLIIPAVIVIIVVLVGLLFGSQIIGGIR